MTVDQLTREYNHKRLRVEFIDGVSEDILVLSVSDFDCHEECKGICYEVLSSSRPNSAQANKAYWTEMKFIKSFEPIGVL